MSKLTKKLKELEKENEILHKSIKELIEKLIKENEELKEALLDCFNQACATDKGYDHMCLSTYESTQILLIELGVINEEDCYRK